VMHIGPEMGRKGDNALRLLVELWMKWHENLLPTWLKKIVFHNQRRIFSQTNRGYCDPWTCVNSISFGHLAW
jgi:hypothetical protein